MALSRSTVDENYIAAGTNTSDYTTGSFAADEGDLLVVAIIWIRTDNIGAYSAPEWTVSSSGMSFTRQIGIGGTSSNWCTTLEVYTALVPSTGSRTVTIGAGGKNHCNWTGVYKYSGADQTTPIRQTKAINPSLATVGNAAYSYDLDSAPLSTSEVMAFTHVDSATESLMTPSTGWTEILDDGSFTEAHVMSRGSSTSTTIGYDDVNVNNVTLYDRWSFGAIEIAAAEEAATAGPPLDFPASPSHNEVFKSNGVFYIFNSSTGAWENYNITVGQNTSIEFGIDGGGSVISVGQKGTIEIPFDLILSGWTMLADQSGSANVDLWSREYSTTLPTQGNTMTGNIGMTISTATANQSTEISNWAMNKINAGNVVTYNVQSCDTITRLSVNLYGTRE